MEGTLERLQNGVYERLRGERDLLGVEILNQCRRDIGNLVRIGLGESLGLCAVVLPPVPVEWRRNCPKPADATVEVRVRVVEDLLSGGGLPGALRVAESIHRCLTASPLPESASHTTLLPRRERPWTVRENFPESSRWEIELIFEAQVLLERSN
jgi:hypothetical protein